MRARMFWVDYDRRNERWVVHFDEWHSKLLTLGKEGGSLKNKHSTDIKQDTKTKLK